MILTFYDGNEIGARNEKKPVSSQSWENTREISRVF